MIMRTAETAPPFGAFIREWRSVRRFSQLQLSVEAEISARHLSFLESGRASPSRAMVLRLAEALQLPREAANAALGAAGFAPAYGERPIEAADLAPVREAIAHMLSVHEPYPAVAIDRAWDVVQTNAASAEMFAAVGVAGAGNMIDALIAAAEGEAIENWEEVAVLALARLRTEIAAAGGDHALERYARQLTEHPRLANFDISRIDLGQAVIPTIFRIAGMRLSLFSTIAQFGSVQDVAAADLRVELMFPADAATKNFFESYS